LDAAAEHLLRELAPQVLGAVVRRFRDFAAAEDAVQEALLAAATQWPAEGVPANPRAWLIQVAYRRMADHLRSEIARRQRDTAVAMESGHVALPAGSGSETEQDDTLILLFCAVPALTPSSAIASPGGEAAWPRPKSPALLVPEATMAQRMPGQANHQSVRRAFPCHHQEGPSAQRSASLSDFQQGYTSSAGAHCSAANYPAKPSG
jgi:predicted RNA polymerase sigma factor